MVNDMVIEDRQRPGAPMTGWPAKPVIYEINTAIWLGDLSRAAGRPVTLADVPASAWDDVTPAGADAVWLMGVWERSPAGLELANANAGLQASFRDALPDLRRADVIGIDGHIAAECVRRCAVKNISLAALFHFFTDRPVHPHNARGPSHKADVGAGQER